MNSTIPYILAVISGLAVPFIPETEPVLVVIGLVYAVVGGAFGFFQPKESWRWGLWIAGPMTLLTGFSVLFAGQVDIFLEKDLPILLVAMAGACAGSLVTSRLKRRKA